MWIRMEVLQSLKEISKTLNEGSDVTTMLNTVLSKLLSVMNLSSGWIFLIDDQGRHTLAASFNVPPALAKEGCSPLKNGGCWCKSKYIKKELKHAVNMIECQRIEQAIQQKSGDTEQITHHATIPILAGDKPLGILNVASPNKVHYELAELDLLETIGYQIGTAINRVQLFENEFNRVQELHQLNTFLQRLHSLTAETSPKQLEEELRQAFHFQEITLHMYEQEMPELILNQNECSDLIKTELIHHLYLYKEKQRLLQLANDLTRREEREQLARDLHDSVNQLLFTIQLRLKGLSLRINDAAVQEELTTLGSVVHEALKELKLIIQCRHASEENNRLHETIMQYGKLIGLQVYIDGEVEINVPDDMQTDVYRLLQEAINNTKKHTTVERIHIRVDHHHEGWILTIKDDGCGFDQQHQRHKTLGLESIFIRAEKLGGKATLHTGLGSGTTWEVFLPAKRREKL